MVPAGPGSHGAALIIGSALKYAKVGFHEGAQAGALQGTRAGPITVGSRNVFINGKAAALACLSLANCTQHGDGKQVAQGSQTVQINGHRMARVGDGGVCGFVIGEGSPNVFAGAPPASCHGLAVGSEIPKGLSDAVDTAGTWGERLEIAGGFLMGGTAGLKMLATRMGALTLAGGLAGGTGGGYLASSYARRHGMSESDQMMFGDFGGLAGAMLGGGAVSKAGGLFGRAPVVSEGAGVGEPPLVDRATLNPKDIFPGEQTEPNCAPLSCQQIARVATGNNIPAAEITESAKVSADYDPRFGVEGNRIPDILNAEGVPARNIPNTPESIRGALDEGRGVVSGHRVKDLWPGDPNFVDDPSNPIPEDALHAVHTIDTVRDADGNVTGYVINDTGTGTAGRVVPAEQYDGSLATEEPATATDSPIYEPYKPVEALPENVGGSGTDAGEGGGKFGAAGNSSQGTVTGKPTKINPEESVENIRALTLENETPHILADNGYNVEQNPPPPGNGKKPDYRIDTGNGPEYYDNYAPTTPNVRNIGGVVQQKVSSAQANSIVVNLDDTPVTPEQLRVQIRDWTGPDTPKLREVLTIKNGQVVRVYP